MVEVVKAIFFQQNWLAVCYGNLPILRRKYFS